MKFIIEPINDKDCRIVDIDFTRLQGKSISELTIPPIVEQDGKTYNVKEVGRQVCFTFKGDENTSKYASLGKLKKLIFSEGIEVIEAVMEPDNISNAEGRGNTEYLTDVVLPSTLKVIGKFSFMSCKSLCNINIPSGLEEIGKQAFAYCESLEWFQWPASLKKVDLSASQDMKKPTDAEGNVSFELVIPDSIESIEGERGYSKIKCKVSSKAWSVLDASELTKEIVEINIPEGVKQIKGHFENIREVTLPSTLEEIGEEAFFESEALQVISEFPKSLRIIGDRAFSNNLRDELKEIAIQSPEMKIGRDAFLNRPWNKGRVKLTGDEATMNSLMKQPGALNGTLIESINIPEGATEVEVEYCDELVSLNIPNTVTHIEKIKYCPKLESFIIPNSVKTIGEIENCDCIKSLIIPDSVIKIGTITKNDSLEELILSKNLVEFAGISNLKSLKYLKLPDSIKEFTKDKNGWYGDRLNDLKAEINASPRIWKLICSTENALEGYAPASDELILPEGIEEISPSLLRYSKLKRIKLPASVKKISEGAFVESKELESVEFPEDSQLKEIGNEAFAKTKLKEMRFPDGFSKLEKDCFKDIETLENLIFPASMRDYGFEEDMWGNIETPVVRCKNLKYVVFLSDDPTTAVYPIVLGKLCDWYVPDNMVDFVKSFIEKAKAEHPKAKGVGAKNVKPLSKLKREPVENKKKVVSKKTSSYTQSVSLKTIGLIARYCFPVSQNEMDMLSNKLDLFILAAKYLKNNKEGVFEIVDRRSRGSACTVDELSLNTKVNSAPETVWHATPKTLIDINFSNVSDLPEDFPTSKKMIDSGSLTDFISSKVMGYQGELMEGAPAYIRVSVNIDIVFDFKIPEKEKFNVKKIMVMKDWEEKRGSKTCCRFALLYNNRYIPATSVIGKKEGSFSISTKAYSDAECNNEISVPDTVIEGVEYDKGGFKQLYNVESLPHMNEILSILK